MTRLANPLRRNAGILGESEDQALIAGEMVEHRRKEAWLCRSFAQGVWIKSR